MESLKEFMPLIIAILICNVIVSFIFTHYTKTKIKSVAFFQIPIFYGMEVFEKIKGIVESKMPHYNTIVLTTKSENMSFEIYNVGDFTEIQYAELKQIVLDSTKQ